MNTNQHITAGTIILKIV